MKIAVTGTHGAGKTTLCYKLAAHYKSMGKSVEMVQEVARRSPFPINNGMTKDTVRWIYHEHSKLELELEHKCDILICDRTSIDSYIYGSYFDLNDSYIPFEKLDSYEKIIFVKPDMKCQADGIRSTDETFRESIHFRFDQCLKMKEHISVFSTSIFDPEESWKNFCL